MKDTLVICENTDGTISYKDYSVINDKQDLMVNLEGHLNTIGIRKIIIHCDIHLAFMDGTPE